MKVIVEHTSNFSARLIQFWMWVDALVHLHRPRFTYNHALIEHNGMVWEAIDKGVKNRTISDHYADAKYRKPYVSHEIELPLTDVELQRAISYLQGQEGKPYEYANFVWHVVKTFGHWQGDRTDRKLYCYELVIRAMNFTGKYQLSPFLNPREFVKVLIE